MNTNQKKYALISGISLVLLAVMAGITYGYLHTQLVVQENAETTLKNLQSSPVLFHLEIAGWIIILILDVIISWGLYKLTYPFNFQLSLVTALLRIGYTILLGIGIASLLNVPNLVGTEAAEAVLENLNSFYSFWSIGLAVFGFHLVGLGLVFRNTNLIPGLLSALLVFAGICYVGIHSARVIFPEMESQIVSVEMALALPMGLAEVLLAVWLIVRGLNAKNFGSS